MNAESGRVLAALAQFFIGPIQDLLKLGHPAAVVVGVNGAVGQPLAIRHMVTNACTRLLHTPLSGLTSKTHRNDHAVLRS